MNANNFDEYIRQGEPSCKEKAQIWQTAIGLQGVDGLKPSQYLLDSAKANIEGDITIAEVKKRLESYYKQERKKAPLNRSLHIRWQPGESSGDGDVLTVNESISDEYDHWKIDRQGYLI